MYAHYFKFCGRKSGCSTKIRRRVDTVQEAVSKGRRARESGACAASAAKWAAEQKIFNLWPAMGSKAHKPKLKATQNADATIQSDHSSATAVSAVVDAGGDGGAASGVSGGGGGPRASGDRFDFSGSFGSIEL